MRLTEHKPMAAERVIIEAESGELLPCPFCGSPCSFEHDKSGDLASWYVYCRDVKDECPIGYTNSIGYARRVEAAANWNKRHA